MPRPPSSARPSTSASGPVHPTTAGGFSPYDPTLEEEEFDDDDESDAEDVFAFLPPTTAEQQEQAAQHTEEQAQAHMGDTAARGQPPQMMQYHQSQSHYQQAMSPYGSHGAGTAAAAAAALQTQYYGRYQENPHVSAPFSPFSHSPFPPAGAASSSTLDLTPSTSDAYSSWERPSTSHLVAGRSASHLSEADIAGHRNALAGPSNTAFTVLNRPTTVPQSPPSPSTDSQPSTGAGMPSYMDRGDMYKLRRLTSTHSVAPAVSVEGGQRVVQEDDDEEDEDDVVDKQKEVVVSLPHGEEPPDSPNTKLGDDDDGATMASEKGRAALRLESPPAGRGRRVRAGKHRSTDGSNAYAEDVRSAEAGGIAVGVLGYDGAVASGVPMRKDGPHRRMKNVNAQPYYAYAAIASAQGYETRGSSRSNTRGTAQQRPGTTQTTIPESSQRRSFSGSFVSTGKRRGKDDFDDGEEIDEYDYADADTMSVSGVSASIRDDESREGSIKMEFDFDAIEEEDSPFAEVRASVSNIDDPDMPAMTIRMWVVGLLLCMTSTALNVFFNFRAPAPTIVPLALVLLSYPFGKFLAFSLPITTYRIPLPNLPRRWFPTNQPSFALWRLLTNLMLPLTYPRCLEFSLNPGPWNIKEHVLVYIMANVAVGPPYALNAIVVSNKFYHIHIDYWFSLTLVLATQLTGFGLAGLCRRFLVWPASMVWPQNLVACTLLNTLHAEDDDDGIGMYGGTYEPGSKGMSRYKFYIITTAASFVFFFLPGYLFEALSVFSFICWAAPNNVPVNQLFGVSSGLGMSILTFDWTQISWIGSPLMVPWWAEVHVIIGFVLFFWIMTPILYYTNSWDLAYFPISANEPFDRFGQTYNVSRILMLNDTFDSEAYFNYSPLYLPATYAVTYLLAFALSTCVIVHTGLYHGKALFNGLRKVRVEADDIHAKLMRNYPEVPDWWYLVSFCVFFALAVVTVEVWHTDVPVWALLLSVLLPVIYVLPSGFIYAMTGQGITINILAQIIPGTLLPGKPLVNMLFKAYSVQTLAAATSFVQDLKLGHYVKVPPRATFIVQMVSTVLAAFIQVGVKEWIFKNVPDICSDNQKSQLTCPHNQVFFTASAVWGLIGPTKQFGTGSLYHPHLYAIIVGAFLPLPFYLWQRKYPNSWARYVSTPVILNGVSSIPPATGINYSSWFAVGFAFQYLIRKRNFAWWSKFNYVLSSALDSGTVIAVMVIFFTLQFPRGGTINVNWWGNQVFTATADYQRKTFLPIPPGGVTWKGFPPALDSAGNPIVVSS